MFSENKKKISVLDKSFEIYISDKEIQDTIQDIANQINKEYADKNPLFIIVLNGAFMFGSDLLKKINIDCEVSFLRIASYEGLKSTESVRELLSLTNDLNNRHVIIVEDIVDTGLTMEYILNSLKQKNTAGVKICTLLYKKEAFKYSYPIDYICFTIPNNFVVGYGLDYNGYGRNYKDIYTLINE